MEIPLSVQNGSPPESPNANCNWPLAFVATVNVRWVNWPLAVATPVTFPAPLVMLPNPAGTVTFIWSRDNAITHRHGYFVVAGCEVGLKRLHSERCSTIGAIAKQIFIAAATNRSPVELLPPRLTSRILSSANKLLWAVLACDWPTSEMRSNSYQIAHPMVRRM